MADIVFVRYGQVTCKTSLDPLPLEPSYTTPPDILLRVAVLERAVLDIIGCNKGKRTAEAAHSRQAWSWIRSNSRAQNFLTFLDVCEALNLDPIALRRKIETEITNQSFINRFERVPDVTSTVTSCLPKMGRQRVVRYHKKDMLGRGQDRRSTSKASAEETNDQLACESNRDAE